MSGRCSPGTILLVDGETRSNFPDSFVVYRTENGGDSWDRMTNGLPSRKPLRLGVLGHGMFTDRLDECGACVGTNTGQIFGIADWGESWSDIADFLPPVFSVSTAVVAG